MSPRIGARDGGVGRAPDRSETGAVGMRRVAALLALLCPAGAGAEAAGGAEVFARHCVSCHAIAAEAPVMAGPNLAGVVGRPIAGDAAFDYSPALQALHKAGQAWDAAALDRFLTDPEAMVPGTWMGANRLREAGDRAAVVEYLRAPAPE